MLYSRLACALLLLLCPFASATAAPIGFGFSGVIDFLDDPTNSVPGIGVGTAFAGSYTIDPDLISAITASGPGDLYVYSGSLQLDADVGGSLFSQSGDSIAIGDAATSPTLGVADFWGTSINVQSAPQIAVGFIDTGLTRISDPSIFFVNDSLAGWDLSIFSISIATGEPFAPSVVVASGPISSLLVVPEPGTALLVALGLSCLGSARKRAR